MILFVSKHIVRVPIDGIKLQTVFPDLQEYFGWSKCHQQIAHLGTYQDLKPSWSTVLSINESTLSAFKPSKSACYLESSFDVQRLNF